MIARRKNGYWVSAALLIACAGLGWVIYAELRAAPSWRVSNAVPSGSEPVQAPRPEARFSIPPPERFAAIVERPIFSRSRSPFTDDEIPEPEIESDLDAVLIGTIISSEQEIALVVPKGSVNFIRLNRGDRLQGWILESIELDRVTFSRNGVEAQIELSYDRPPPARTRARAASPRTRPAKVPPAAAPGGKPAGSDR